MSNQNLSNLSFPSEQLNNAFQKLEISKPLDKKKDEYLKNIRSQKRKGHLQNKRLAATISLSSQLENMHIYEDTLGQGLSIQEFIVECQERTYTLTGEQLTELVASIYSPSLYRQYFGVIGIRKLLATVPPPIQPLIGAGIVPRLVEFLGREDEHQLQVEAAWALSNLSSGTTEQTRKVVENGAIPALIKLLGSPSKDVKGQAVWTLGNIAGDNAYFRDIALQGGMIGPLIKIIEVALVEEEDKPMIKNGNWALSNICRGKPLPAWKDTKEALPIFARVTMGQEDPEILMDALWSLADLSDGGEERTQQVLDTGVVPSIVKHMENNPAGLLFPCVRILGNLLTGTNEQVNNLLAVPGVVEKLFGALRSPLKNVRREATWALSNLAAGSSEHLGFIVGNPEYLDQLISIGLNDVIEVRKEIAWIFSNALNNANQEQLRVLLGKKIMRFFGKMIEEHRDAKAQEVGLEGILKILKWRNLRAPEESFGDDCWSLPERNQIVSVIEKLLSHPSRRIYELAERILEYVESGEDEDVDDEK